MILKIEFMKKVRFIGTMETFYFVPNCEEETAVIYLDVVSEQKLPDGREETVSPVRRMRFVLQGKELGILSKEKAMVRGDKISITVNERSDGGLLHNVNLLERKTPIVDAREYVKNLT